MGGVNEELGQWREGVGEGWEEELWLECKTNKKTHEELMIKAKCFKSLQMNVNRSILSGILKYKNKREMLK